MGKPAALLAAFVAAAHPLLIAFSGVLGRQPTYLFAAFGSILALIGFLKRGQCGPIHRLRSRRRSGDDLASGGRAGAGPVSGGRCCWCRRSRRHAGGGGPRAGSPDRRSPLRTLSYALESKPPSGGTIHLGRAPLLWTVLFDRDFTPLAWIVAWTAGPRCWAFGGAPRGWRCSSLLGLDIVWRWTGVYQHVRRPRAASGQRALRSRFSWFRSRSAWRCSSRPCSRRAAWLKVGLVAVFIACTAVTFRRPYETLLRPFTVDHEYRFLEEACLDAAAATRASTSSTHRSMTSGSSTPIWSASSPAAR